MADQNIGAARVHLVVDATDWDSTLAQARNAAAQFGTDAERAFEKSEGGVRRAATRLLDYAASLGRADTQMERYIRNASRAGVDEPIIRAAIARWEEYQNQVRETTAAIEKEIAAERKLQATRKQGEQFLSYLKNLRDTAGKTHYEILELKAAQLGISAEAGPLIQAIKQQNEAMGAGTLTTKQYEWAMRGLPAQLTDISVGLATGQKPLMVFLQQGGQLKDMFGGIVPAAKAVAGAVWGMVNPLTITAATLGTLVVAAHQAERATFDLEKALITTGGYAATSSRQLRGLINTIADLKGVTAGGARAAVLELAETGRFTGEQFELVAVAAARMEAAAGVAVSETINKFREIAKDPVDALLEFNRAEHFLTQAQLDRIDALIEEGKEQEAVTEAIRIYAERTNEVSTAVENARPHLAQMGVELREIASAAWEGTKNFAEFLAATARVTQQRPWWQRNGLLGGINFLRDMYRAEPVMPADIPTVADAVDSDAVKEQRDALEENRRAWERLVERGMSPAAKLQEEINEIERVGIALGKDRAQIEELIAAARARAASRDRGSRRGRDGTAAIRDAAQAEIAAITTQTRLLQSQYEQRAITVEDYYDRLHAFADEELAVTLRSIEAQKAAVAGREDSAQRIEQLESQAARAREQHIQREIELDEQRRRAVQQREIAFRDYVRSLDDANEAAQRDADLAVARVSMGAKEYERMVALNNLLRRRMELEEELDRRVADGNLNPDDALRYRDALERVNEQVRILTEGWDRVDKAQANALNGISSAWENWLAQTRDVAAQWSDIFTSAISGLSDGIADMLAANEQDWDAYFQNLHTMILRFIVQQQLTKFMESIMGGGSNGWGNIFSLFGSRDSFTGFAHGGTPGGAGLSAYRNSIVSQPTFFPFARGGVPNIGLMGERSGKPHEAIMPLTRTSSGDLGVRVVESNQRGPTYINQQFVVQGTPDRSTREHMAKKAGREISRAMSRT